MRVGLAVTLTLLALAAPACAGTPGEIETTTVGRGAEGAVIVQPSDADEPVPTVIFLHGWGAVNYRQYGPWLRHLAERGNAVIYPVYQRSYLSDPANVYGDALDGIRAALEEVEEDPSAVVVTGHSAGGALAADYAAGAVAAGLPRPRGVLTLYPGRRLSGFPQFIPVVPPEQIAADTRILALAGDDDRVVGDGEARALVRGAVRVPRAQRRFELIRDARVDDHFAPARADAAARRVFWGRLDRLIAAVQRGPVPR